jgi:transcriptional regulator with XRE-family HTH domain
MSDFSYSFEGLKAEVKAKGLVKTAAEKLGIPYNTFVEYLNGRKLNKISDETVKEWCKILEIDPKKVFPKHGKQKKEEVTQEKEEELLEIA